MRLYNERGACLGGADLDEGVARGVVVMATGAWFDPRDAALERHGNPNVLTRDEGTSRLAQGCSALSALVQAENGPAGRSRCGCSSRRRWRDWRAEPGARPPGLAGEGAIGPQAASRLDAAKCYAWRLKTNSPRRPAIIQISRTRPLVPGAH